MKKAITDFDIANVPCFILWLSLSYLFSEGVVGSCDGAG